jgi:hypothetical protein
MKTIHLTEEELKNILADYIGRYDAHLAGHMRNNHCAMEWAGNDFVVSMDGEVSEERIDLPLLAERGPDFHWTPPHSRSDEGDIPF